MENFAKRIRLELLKTLMHLGFGHFGGSLSIVETLAVLYGKHMTIYPENPKHPNRDYFILSKGHAGPALYATLALKGFFPLDMLDTLNQNGTHLPSHPDCHLTPGVDMTTGSLGQGISVASGIAYYHHVNHLPNKIFCIVGDGELNEGQCWEAFQFIAHHQLKNLIVFIDENKKQLDGTTSTICNPFDFVQKMQSFGFHSLRIKGNDVNQIDLAIQEAYSQDKPTAIILDTIKAQGVPYLEQKEDNHHIRPNKEDSAAIQIAISQLEEELNNGNA
ncbi:MULTISPECIES: transketolase [unclassified Granulicatella]|uniref:transketolase n=1 Tax=unclassified Granulicatella TaxID=2630493 RepID=UPI001073E650|nr:MULTISPECIES: transketolase [unclassified Granulicatella]MBF0779891.1 transketolase [Granulicatella sp. 19428wC4_WM01]TFU96095.1 transketolase [Granulicatella sp. WM01]